MRLTQQSSICWSIRLRGRTVYRRAGKRKTAVVYFYSGCMIAAIFKSMQIKKTEEKGRMVHLVICDVQSSYAEKLLRILAERLPDAYEFHLFCDIEKLKGFSERAPSDILLIGEEFSEEDRRRIPADKKFLLTGIRDGPDCEEIPVFRYQSADRIIENIFSQRNEREDPIVKMRAELSGKKKVMCRQE